MRRDVYQAIADPTRRSIIELIARGPMNVNAIAQEFDQISRPAISKHLKILEECGMLAFEKVGRERICSARMGPLEEVSAWVEQYRSFWNNQLDELDAYLQNLQSNQQNNEFNESDS